MIKALTILSMVVGLIVEGPAAAASVWGVFQNAESAVIGHPAATPTDTGLLTTSTSVQNPASLSTTSPTLAPIVTATQELVRAQIPTIAPEPTVRCPLQSEVARFASPHVKPLTSEPLPLCAYTWKYDGGTFDVSCPASWECEISPPVDHVVFLEYGPVGSRAAVGGTWRYLPTYPNTDGVHNECAFFARVQANAESSGWTAETYPQVC